MWERLARLVPPREWSGRMSVIRVDFLYRVGPPTAPLRVTRESLGKSYGFSLGGIPIEITLPRRPDDWLSWKPFVAGEYQTFIDWGDQDEVSLHIIRLTVSVDADVSAAAPLEGETVRRAVKAIDEAQEIAAHVIKAFIAWVRATTRMTDLPLSSEVPPLAGPVLAVDTEAGLPFRTGPSVRTVLVARDPAGKYRLAPEDMDQIIDRIQQDEEAPIAETLLADAEHYALHRVLDLRRAVLMAAIACEVKVKEILRNRATAAQRSLLDFALDNQREVTVTAANGLFDKLMLATLGRSLRLDDKKLFNDVVHLYKVRNDIAHHGIMPDAADADRVVRAARRCFIWLDSQAAEPTP
jgi:hypothetical protein